MGEKALLRLGLRLKLAGQSAASGIAALMQGRDRLGHGRGKASYGKPVAALSDVDWRNAARCCNAATLVGRGSKYLCKCDLFFRALLCCL